jgi:hypothetical protein
MQFENFCHTKYEEALVERASVAVFTDLTPFDRKQQAGERVLNWWQLNANGFSKTFKYRNCEEEEIYAVMHSVGWNLIRDHRLCVAGTDKH